MVTEAIAPAQGAVPSGPDPAGLMPDAFDEFWNSVLRAGVWGENTRREAEAVSVDASVIDGLGVEAPEFSGSSDSYPFILHPYLSQAMHDGSGANLPWMQELPDPMTKVVYGSWLEIIPPQRRNWACGTGTWWKSSRPAGPSRRLC